jgi:membrane-associated phospholipid phosphatase
MSHFLKMTALSAVTVSLVCVGLFYYVDRPLAWIFYGLHDTLLLQTSEYVTWIGTPKWWLVISLLAFLIAGLGYQLRNYTWQCRALLYFGATNMLALVIGSVLKFILGRYRPAELFQDNGYGLHFFSTEWVRNSMPSGHALAAFAAATALSILYRRYSVLFFTVAFLVALSRLVLNVHYLSDLVLGGYIGILSALFMRYALYKESKIRTC